MYLKSHIKSECCGCRACIEACPKSCITMISDEESFLYPAIDMSECIKCHKCETVCPMTKTPTNEIKSACVGIHKDDKITFESSSGGAFSAITEPLLEKGYTVFGVKYGERFEVQHGLATTKDEMAAFRKSKYVLSNTNGSYERVKSLLSQNKMVIFSGTPCQVAALKSFLGFGNDNLITIDVVCHGAPSQTIFDDELQYFEYKYQSPVIQYEFRNKRVVNDKEIDTRSAYVKLASGKELIFTINDDPYLKGYYTRLFYRPSCGVCPFAIPKRNSDITLADAWGIDNVYPDLKAVSGVSMLLANTDKGQRIIDEIAKTLNLRNIDINWAVKANEQLHKPTDMHSKRELFFRLWKDKGYMFAVHKCTNKSIIRKFITKMMPLKLKVKVKSLMTGGKK